MRNAVATLTGTVVIDCEVEFVPMYRGQPLFGDIQCFLREQGFMLHKFIDVDGRAFRRSSTKARWLRQIWATLASASARRASR